MSISISKNNFNVIATKTLRHKEELQKLLTPDYRQEILKQYDILEQKLGGIGASKKTANLIVADLKNQ